MPLGRGYEHSVFGVPETSRVLKFTHPDTAGFDRIEPPTVTEYLQRLQLGNQELGDDVVLEGVLNSEAGIVTVTSQPFIDAEGDPHPTYEKMNAFVRSLGFKYQSGAWWRESDRLVMEDVHPGNFIVALDGRIVPIDVKLSRVP